jgi:hypothetical protein
MNNFDYHIELPTSPTATGSQRNSDTRVYRQLKRVQASAQGTGATPMAVKEVVDYARHELLAACRIAAIGTSTPYICPPQEFSDLIAKWIEASCGVKDAKCVISGITHNRSSADNYHTKLLATETYDEQYLFYPWQHSTMPITDPITDPLDLRILANVGPNGQGLDFTTECGPLSKGIVYAVYVARVNLGTKTVRNTGHTNRPALGIDSVVNQSVYTVYDVNQAFIAHKITFELQ